MTDDKEGAGDGMVSVEDAIDFIYSALNNAMTEGEFDAVDEVLDNVVDFGANQTPVLLAYASITSVAKDKLLRRADYMRRLRAHLTETQPELVDALLDGLE